MTKQIKGKSGTTYKDHNREDRSLHIERVDGRPLSRSEMDLITRTFGLRF